MRYYEKCKFANSISFLENLTNNQLISLDNRIANSSLFSSGAKIRKISVNKVSEGLTIPELDELDSFNTLTLGAQIPDIEKHLFSIDNVDEFISFEAEYFLTRKPFTSEIIKNESMNAHYNPFKLPKTTTIDDLIQLGAVLRQLQPSFYTLIASLFSKFSEKGAYSASDALVPASTIRGAIHSYISTAFSSSDKVLYLISCIFLEIFQRCKIIANTHPSEKVQSIINIKDRELFLSLEGLYNLYCISVCEGIVDSVLDTISTKVNDRFSISKSESKDKFKNSIASFSFVDSISAIVSESCHFLSSQLREVTHTFHHNFDILKNAVHWAIALEMKPKAKAFNQFAELSFLEECPNIRKLSKSCNALIEFLQDTSVNKMDASLFKKADQIAAILFRSPKLLVRRKSDIFELQVKKNSYDGKLSSCIIFNQQSAKSNPVLVELHESSYFEIEKPEALFKSVSKAKNPGSLDLSIINVERLDAPSRSLAALFCSVNKNAEYSSNVYPSNLYHGRFSIYENPYVDNKYQSFLKNLLAMLTYKVVLINHASSSFKIGFLLESIPFVRGFYFSPTHKYVIDDATIALALGTEEHIVESDVELNANNKLIGADDKYKIFLSKDKSRFKSFRDLQTFSLQMDVLDNSVFSTWFKDSNTKNLCIQALKNIEFTPSDFVDEGWLSYSYIMSDTVALNVVKNYYKSSIDKFANEMSYMENLQSLSEDLILSLRRYQDVSKVDPEALNLHKALSILNYWDIDYLGLSCKDEAKRKLIDIFRQYVASNSTFSFSSTIDFEFYTNILNIGIIEYIIFGYTSIGVNPLSKLNLFGILGQDNTERLSTLYKLFFIKRHSNEPM